MPSRIRLTRSRNRSGPEETRHLSKRQRMRAGRKLRFGILVLLAAAWPPLIGAQSKIASSTESKTAPAFSRALAAEYKRLIRAERLAYQDEFDAGHFHAKSKAAVAQGRVEPEPIGRYGLRGSVYVALREARVRLMRALGGRSRSVAPAIAARTQAAFDCWISRAGARLPARDVEHCRRRFNLALYNLETTVLPIGSKSAFLRALAHEYLAYANFEAKDQQDLIDARHFARKGLKAARTTQIDAVMPEVLARWNLVSGQQISRFINWRERLVRALEDHRETSLARTAARAQARFDCWIERVSERAEAALIAQCRSGFMEAMRILEGKPKRRSTSLLVAFSGRSTGLSRNDLVKLRKAAALASRSAEGAVSVVGRTAHNNPSAQDVRLALRRAEAVSKALQKMGVAADRIRVVLMARPTHGLSRPGDGASTAARRRLRHAEIIVH